MHIERVMVLSGPNVWSSDPVLEVWIEPERNVVTNARPRPDIRERISDWFLSLTAHRLPLGRCLPSRPSTDQFSFESACGGSEKTVRVAVDGMFDVTEQIHPEVAESIIDAVRMVGIVREIPRRVVPRGGRVFQGVKTNRFKVRRNVWVEPPPETAEIRGREPTPPTSVLNST